MNKLLHKDTKLAIKTIGTTPQNLSFALINKFPVEFKTYEICHIALLIMGIFLNIFSSSHSK